MERPCLFVRDVLSASFAASNGISCEAGGGGQRESTLCGGRRTLV